MKSSLRMVERRVSSSGLDVGLKVGRGPVYREKLVLFCSEVRRNVVTSGFQRVCRYSEGSCIDNV